MLSSSFCTKEKQFSVVSWEDRFLSCLDLIYVSTITIYLLTVVVVLIILPSLCRKFKFEIGERFWKTSLNGKNIVQRTFCDGICSLHRHSGVSVKLKRNSNDRTSLAKNQTFFIQSAIRTMKFHYWLILCGFYSPWCQYLWNKVGFNSFNIPDIKKKHFLFLVSVYF